MRINNDMKYIVRRTVLTVIITAIVSGVLSGYIHSRKTISNAETIDVVAINVSYSTELHANSVQTNTELVDKDLMLLAKLIQSEAIGESYAGKLAVGTVVMNRIADGRWGNTVADVVYAKSQFNGVGTNLFEQDPNEDCIKAADAVLHHGYRSFNGSIIYYFNPKVATDKNFMRTVNVVATVGNHKFGTERRR